MLNLPLVLGRELIGVVKWGDERASRRFGISEIQFAKTLANQATIAVHNARLFEERARRINTLSELYQASVALSTSVESGRGAAPHQHRGARNQRRRCRLALHLRRAHRFIHARLRQRRHRRLESCAPAQHRHDPPRGQRRQAHAGDWTRTPIPKSIRTPLKPASVR